MRHLLNVCGIATAAIALAAVMPSAVAQQNTMTYSCRDINRRRAARAARGSRGSFALGYCV